MRLSKRIFDLAFAAILLIPCLPVMAVVAVLVLLRDGRPILYASERMKSPDQAFTLWKFRTMRVGAAGSERGVCGGDKRTLVTPLGRVLRRSRLDELPQLWNVLRGDMSFVGPRPPLRDYVEKFPILYAPVLQTAPGITGLATVFFHSHEELLLRDTRSAAETEAIYTRRCVPRKAALDRLYLQRQTLGLDLYLIYLTAAKLLPLPGRRVERLKNKSDRLHSPRFRQSLRLPLPDRPVLVTAKPAKCRKDF